MAATARRNAACASGRHACFDQFAPTTKMPRFLNLANIFHTAMG